MFPASQLRPAGVPGQRATERSEVTLLSPDDGGARVHRDVEGGDR